MINANQGCVLVYFIKIIENIFIQQNFLKLRFTPYKTQQLLQGMDSQGKEVQKIKAYRKSF